jgi:hypothetical protein
MVDWPSPDLVVSKIISCPMNQYLQQLNNLAAQNEGGGDDSIPQKWEMRSKGGDYYFVDDKNQRFGGTYKSIEEANKAMSQAKKDGRFQQGVDRMSVRQPGQAPAPGTPAQAQKTGWRDRGAAKSGPFYVDDKGTEYYMKGDKHRSGDYVVSRKEKGGDIESFFSTSGKNEEDAMRSFFNDEMGWSPSLAVSAIDFDEGGTRPDVQLVTQRGTRGGIQDRRRLDWNREASKKYPEDPYYQKVIAKLENKIGLGSDRQPLGPSGQVSYDGPMTGGNGQGQQVDIPYTDPGTAFYHQGDQSNMGVFDPAQSVQQGAAQQSGGGIVSDPNATAGSAAVSPQGLGTENKGFPGERRSRGFGATWEAPGEAVEFTQEDFYPTPPPMVGQYDTGNEYVARSARMPMGALSKAAGALQNRQVELDQKRQAFQEELYKPVKTAAPYQQNFNAIVNKQREDFIQKVAQDLTGGNVNKAYREIFSNPRLRAQYRELNANLEALGQRGASVFAKAENYIKEAAKGGVEGATPQMRKLAGDIIMGLGGYSTADSTGGNFDKLVNDMNRFEVMIDRNQYFKDNVADMVKNFAQRSAVSIDPKTGNTVYGKPSTDDRGRYMFWNKGHLDSFRTQIKELAVSMALDQGYGDGDLPNEKIADNERYLTNMLADKYNMDYVMEDEWSGSRSSSSSGDGGGDKATHEYAYQKINPQGADYENVRKAMKEVGFYLPEGTTTLDSVSFQEVTGGKGGVPKVIPIAGTSVIPLGAYRDGKGKLWLFAKEAKLTGVVDSNKGRDNEAPAPSLTGDDVAKMISTGDVSMSSLPTKLYPFDRYGDVVAKKFGITGEEVNRIINENNPVTGRERTGTQQRAEAPPEPGAVRIEGYDGWWKEVNGEVVKVG